MRKAIVLLLILALGLALVPVAAGAQGSCTVSFLTVWSGEDELPNWNNMIAPWEQQTGCTVDVTSTRDLVPVLTTQVEAGSPPDIAGVPSFGAIKTFLDQGDVIPLNFLDMDRMQQQFGKVWLDLGSVNGTLYGIFTRAAVKSLIWYNKPAFDAAGYTIPATWDDLLALCDQIVNDGSACFSIGLESGAASGWPGTDWIEDIMLRTAGPDAYDAWINHGISWTGPEVTKAWQTFGDIVGNQDYQYGGSAGTLATNFGDAPCPLFTDPPGAFLHRQASFIQSFILQCPGAENLVPGTDFDFFGFPQIDPMYGNPIEGSADLFVAFNDNPNVESLITFLTQPDALTGWLQGGGSGIATNNQFSMDNYPDVLTRRAAEVLQSASSFRFDASDLMPGDVGQAFLTGVLDFVQNPDQLPDVLQTIEDVATTSYAPAEATPEATPGM